MTAFRERAIDTEAWIGTKSAMAGCGLVPRRPDSPAPAATGGGAGERSAKLARVVEAQVIPRLVQAHLADARRGAGPLARVEEA